MIEPGIDAEFCIQADCKKTSCPLHQDKIAKIKKPAVIRLRNFQNKPKCRNKFTTH